MRRAACVAVVVLVFLGPVQAQQPGDGAREDEDPRELLGRAAAWVAGFISDFSNVVAQEEYRQEWQAGERRLLTSDFLLVRYPGRDNLWLAFRDVTAVNGRPVRDQQDRLAKLFLEPFDDAVRRAEEITLEASRHSLVELSVLSSPLVVLAWLQPHYQPDFRYRLGSREKEQGIAVRRLEFEDVPTPSPNLTSAGTPPIAGVAWVEESTGRILKAEARLGRAPNTATSTTTFRFDEALGIHVPAEMKESRVGRSRATRRVFVDQFTGVASYSRFRRFEVKTREEIEDPAGISPR